MKKIFFLIILIISICVVFISCYTEIYDREIDIEVYYGDYITEYKYTPASIKDIEDILSSSYTVNNNKYYFEIKKRYETSYEISSRSMIDYVNIESGENFHICSDFLCVHENPKDCIYLNFSNPFFIDDDIFYDIRNDPVSSHTCIYKVDLNNGTAEISYILQGIYFDMLCTYKDNVYFYEVKQENINNDSQIYYNLKAINGITGIIKDYGNLPDEYTRTHARIFFIDKDTLYFSSFDKIFTTDLSFKNEKIIYNLNTGDWLGDWYYDQKSKELFFGIINQTENTGSVYVYSMQQLCQLELPHENVYCFQLTKSKIYYSPYDPLYYGISAAPGNPEVYDYTGGKIYATHRNNPSEAVLIFDRDKDFLIYLHSIVNYVIIGDYLYFDDIDLIENTVKEKVDGGRKDVTYTYFSMAYKINKVRINLSEHTIKYIKFE